MAQKFDYMVIGAGMAGASAAFELSKLGSVVVLEQEAQPGYHSTGRSAALFLETYGNATIRGLTRGSRASYESSPAAFGAEPVMQPRGALLIARPDGLDALEAHFTSIRALVASARWVPRAELYRLAPCLAAERWSAGVFEPEACDLDVHAIHQGFLRALKSNGGALIVSAQVQSLGRVHGDWLAETTAGAFSAPCVVNAAGAWGDHIAMLAGVAQVGLQPKRRTGVIIDAPAGVDVTTLPHFGDVDETFYVKPQGNRLFISPCDETDVAPGDAAPEAYDIAVAVHRVEEATTFSVSALSGKLAGLRSFVADRTPVVGFGTEGFFWLVGQGGYGIQTAPAMSRVCAALITGKPIPADLQDLGVESSALSPQRSSCRPMNSHPEASVAV